MWKDPIVEEIHKYRQEHAAKFNYDIQAIAADWIRQQKESGDQFVSFAPKKPPRKRTARPTRPRVKASSNSSSATGTASVKKRLYLETTIISYLTARPSRDLMTLALQHMTADWWERRHADFDLYVSQFVLDEAARGDPDAAARRLACMQDVPLLEVNPEAIALAGQLIKQHVLPEKAADDAFHIALAAVQGIDLLLTWNCAHIANVELRPAIQATIEGSGYICPIICTPIELLGGSGQCIETL